MFFHEKRRQSVDFLLPMTWHMRCMIKTDKGGTLMIILETFAIGVFATLAMIGFLLFVEHLTGVKPRDLWIFGRLFTKDTPRARTLEIAVHCVGGIFFAALYTLGWSLFDIPLYILPAVGLMTGLVHGAGVAISQIAILQNKPSGFRVASTHALSHAVFGFVLGIMASFAQSEFEYMDRYAELIRGDQVEVAVVDPNLP